MKVPKSEASSGVAVAGVVWKEFRKKRPDLAAAGERLLYYHGIGLGFLATIRADGGPRVHPICPLLGEDRLFGLIVPGPKLIDLKRDPRYALHGETYPPPHHDDAFYVAGQVVWPNDPELRRRLDQQMLAERKLSKPWPGFERQVLVEFLIARCLLTLTVAEDGLPAGHTKWSISEGSLQSP